MNYEVVLCESFKKAVKALNKRYPHIKDDVKGVINTLQIKPDTGVVVKQGKGIRKIRVKNSDLRKGKSGSYRVLYYVMDQPNQVIYMIFIYEKSDKEDVSRKEIIELLKAADLL